MKPGGCFGHWRTPKETVRWHSKFHQGKTSKFGLKVFTWMAGISKKDSVSLFLLNLLQDLTTESKYFGRSNNIFASYIFWLRGCSKEDQKVMNLKGCEDGDYVQLEVSNQASPSSKLCGRGSKLYPWCWEDWCWPNQFTVQGSPDSDLVVKAKFHGKSRRSRYWANGTMINWSISNHHIN